MDVAPMLAVQLEALRDIINEVREVVARTEDGFVSAAELESARSQMSRVASIAPHIEAQIVRLRAAHSAVTGAETTG